MRNLSVVAQGSSWQHTGSQSHLFRSDIRRETLCSAEDLARVRTTSPCCQPQALSRTTSFAGRVTALTSPPPMMSSSSATISALIRSNG